MESWVIILVGVFVILLITTILMGLSRYRKCPSDKIMVVYGKVGLNKDGSTKSAKCIHGGASFIWPVFQSSQYLDLTPMSISVDLKNALSKQNIRIDVPSRFTVGISTEGIVMQNAAERLLGLPLSEIQELAKDIIFGQLRLVIATMEIEEINTDRDKFLEAVSRNVEGELKKIGLRLINVNVTDITDESGYIVALGKEAAAKAINDAKVSVAEADREGAIGEANASREQRIKVSLADAEAVKGENEARANVANSEATLREQKAEALRRATTTENVQTAKAINDAKILVAESDREGAIGEANSSREQRIHVSLADAEAVKGENEARANIANSEATLREQKAEADRRATVAENVQTANALEESYIAEQTAEISRAKKEKATLEADIIIKAEIDKREIELQAEAAAEKTRRLAKGEADAIYAKMEAEARGIAEILIKQAAGLSKIVDAAGGNTNDAVRLMIADKLESLVQTQVDAIKNIKIDKITVWDTSSGKDGSTSTANFLQGMLKAVPPISEIFDLADMSLPEFLGKSKTASSPDSSLNFSEEVDSCL